MVFFCVDFLMECQSKYLLLKRVCVPLKSVFWVVECRMRFGETIQQLTYREMLK